MDESLSCAQYNKALDPKTGMTYYVNRVTLQVRRQLMQADCWLLIAECCVRVDELETASYLEGCEQFDIVSESAMHEFASSTSCQDDPSCVSRVCVRTSVVVLWSAVF
jgi:hypothetical protein